MKYAIVLPDGAADDALAQLNGRTPLEAAQTPAMDWISINGRQGRVVTVPEGFLPASDVATLSLFGYDPRRDYDGRAPFEAAAQGLKTNPTDLIFRCNFVTVIDGTMADFTAGHISQGEAAQLINTLNEELGTEGIKFHAGVSYRNLMVLSNPGEMELKTTPPHDIPDQPIDAHLPKGSGAEKIHDLMTRAAELLATHAINTVRQDLSENPATNIWLWGCGRLRALEPFSKRFGLTGCTIAGVDLIRGIAKCAGHDLIDVPGATGYLDTDYQAKGLAAVRALDDYDVVVVHVEAPDEAGHLGDLDAKIKAIEEVDRHVVGPLLEKLKTFDSWRILVAPDHPTPVTSRVHTADPPPFCLAGTAITSVLAKPFGESASSQSDLQVNPGHELMEYFLKV